MHNTAKAYGETNQERVQYISEDENNYDDKDSSNKGSNEEDYESVLDAGKYSEIRLTCTIILPIVTI